MKTWAQKQAICAVGDVEKADFCVFSEELKPAFFGICYTDCKQWKIEALSQNQKDDLLEMSGNQSQRPNRAVKQTFQFGYV